MEKRIEKKKQVHQKIVNAAKEIFSKRGFNETSMQEIASAAGVSKGLLFWYFHNKDELILEVARSSLPDKLIRSCLDQKTEGIELLRNIGMKFLEKYSNDAERSLFLNVLSLRGQYPEIASTVFKVCSSLVEQVAERVFGNSTIENVIKVRAFMGGLMCYVINPLELSEEEYVNNLIRGINEQKIAD
ncbi:TetR/AcrR family transcriptional regulator [Acidianus sp. RZ1]|uniref:TetR/AcrR family transcriptional regulator n=1 Tax=Acidianus sp. RZ1 TaxID=1540082 RepID=UPI0014919CAF|nr:TetR/AcrR family transcriptional regulator [Acidianus sp. RZ1]NON62385.1 TetR/AcrR family transcriptional regulator [Acidianus sp. RZ1]